MTRRVSLTGISTDAPGMSGVRNTRRSIPLPAGSITRIEPALKFGRLAQATIDGLFVIFCFFFLCALAGSVPLAIGLMIFAKFS